MQSTSIDVESGLIDDSNKPFGLERDFRYNNNVANVDIRIRMGFLRKVFGILSVQLAITVVFCALMQIEAVSKFILESTWILLISCFGSFALLFALMANRHKTPHNYLLLFGFTLCNSISIGAVTVMYTVPSVMVAAGLTLVVTVSLMVFALQSRIDFSPLYGTLYAGLLCLIVCGFVQVIAPSRSAELVLASFGVVLFSAFILFDTQNIMRKLSPEEYIIATIDLYLDIINLFLELLRIFGERRN